MPGRSSASPLELLVVSSKDAWLSYGPSASRVSAESSPVMCVRQNGTGVSDHEKEQQLNTFFLPNAKFFHGIILFDLPNKLIRKFLLPTQLHRGVTFKGNTVS